MSDADRRARAEVRRGRVVLRRTKLGDEPAEAAHGTPEERIAQVVVLTRAAWAMAGKEWPAASRRIVRFVPRGES